MKPVLTSEFRLLNLRSQRPIVYSAFSMWKDAPRRISLQGHPIAGPMVMV